MPVLSRSRTFYINGEIKPNNQKKNVEYREHKNNFQQTKNIQQKNTQVICVEKILVLLSQHANVC